MKPLPPMSVTPLVTITRVKLYVTSGNELTVTMASGMPRRNASAETLLPIAHPPVVVSAAIAQAERVCPRASDAA